MEKIQLKPTLICRSVLEYDLTDDRQTLLTCYLLLANPRSYEDILLAILHSFIILLRLPKSHTFVKESKH